MAEDMTDVEAEAFGSVDTSVVPETVERTIPEVDVPNVEPTDIATVERTEVALASRRAVKKPKKIPVSKDDETPLLPQPEPCPVLPQTLEPFVEHLAKDIVPSVKELPDEIDQSKTQQSTIETVQLKTKKHKKSIEILPQSPEPIKVDVSAKEDITVVIESKKQVQDTVEVQPEVAELTIKPKAVSKKDLQTSVPTPVMVSGTALQIEEPQTVTTEEVVGLKPKKPSKKIKFTPEAPESPVSVDVTTKDVDVIIESTKREKETVEISSEVAEINIKPKSVSKKEIQTSALTPVMVSETALPHEEPQTITTEEVVTLQPKKASKKTKLVPEIPESSIPVDVTSKDVEVTVEATKRIKETVEIPTEIAEIKIKPKSISKKEIQTAVPTPIAVSGTEQPSEQVKSVVVEESVQLQPKKSAKTVKKIETKEEIVPVVSTVEAAVPKDLPIVVESVKREEKFTEEVSSIEISPKNKASINIESTEKPKDVEESPAPEQVPWRRKPVAKKEIPVAAPTPVAAVEHPSKEEVVQPEVSQETIQLQPEKPSKTMKKSKATEEAVPKQGVHPSTEVSMVAPIKETAHIGPVEKGTEIPAEVAKKLKKTKAGQRPEMSQFEVESVTLKPVKRSTAPEEVKEDDVVDKDLSLMKPVSIPRDESPELEQFHPTEATAKLKKKKRVVTKPTDSEDLVPEQPESTQFQQEVTIEAVKKEVAETSVTPKFQSKATIDGKPQPKKEEPVKVEEIKATLPTEEQIVPVDKIEKKKKQKLLKTKLFDSQETAEQTEPLATLEHESEVTLPTEIQPETTAITAESVVVAEDVSSEPTIKKKPKTTKAKLVSTTESVTVEQPDVIESVEVKPEQVKQTDVAIPATEECLQIAEKTIRPKPKTRKKVIVEPEPCVVLQPKPVEPLEVEIQSISTDKKPESQEVIELVTKEIEIKKKPKISKTKVHLATESVPVEQVETSEVTLPSQLIETQQVDIKKPEEKRPEKSILLRHSEERSKTPEVAQQDVTIETKAHRKVSKKVSFEMDIESTNISEAKLDVKEESFQSSATVDVVEKVDIPVPVQTKSKKKVVKTVVQTTDDQKEVTVAILEQPLEPVKQVESSTIELKRPKEPKVTTKTVPAPEPVVKDVAFQEMVIETKSVKKAEPSAFQLEQPGEIQIVQKEVVPEQITIETKSKKTDTKVQESRMEISTVSLDTKDVVEKTDESIVIKKKESTIKRKSKKISREQREATPVTLDELSAPELEQVMLEESQPAPLEYAEMKMPETKKATIVQQAVTLDSSGPLGVPSPVMAAVAQPKQPIREETITTVPYAQVQAARLPDYDAPLMATASSSSTTQQAITVTESVGEEQPDWTGKRTTPAGQKANVKMLLKEAVSICHDSSLDGAHDLSAGKLPATVSVTPKLDVREGLQCQEVQAVPVREEPLGSKPFESASASVEMVSSIPLEVGQVELFNKPEKYVPALFVATEKARPHLTTETALITTEMRAPESEGTYSAGRLPPTQQANVAVSFQETASVSQPRVHEFEGAVEFQKPQETATTSLEPVSAIVAVVTKPEAQLTAEELTGQPVTVTKKGNVSIVPHESVIQDETQTAEREVGGIVKLPAAAMERLEPVMVTSKSLSVHSQQPYQAGDVLEQVAVMPSGKTAKKVQDVTDTFSSYQVVPVEATGNVEETKTPAGQEATAGYVALESASTAQKISYETEGDWTESARLPSLPAPKSFVEALPVAQTDSTVIVHKESTFAAMILPESNQASFKMDSFLTAPKVVTVDTLQSAEPLDKPSVVTEVPKVVGTAGQSLPSIEQVYVQEAATKFQPKATPESKQAAQVLDDEESVPTSAQTGETWTHESVVEGTASVPAASDQAQVSMQPHVAAVQLSVVPSSAGDVLKEETPLLQSAKSALAPGLQNIASAQQTPSHEREGHVPILPTVPSLTASLSVQAPMENSTTQVIQPGFKEQVLPQFVRPEVDKASVSVSSDSCRSLLPVTAEVGSSECVASYVPVASVVESPRFVQEVHQSVKVTANEPAEREAEFVSDTMPQQQTITHTAHLVSSASAVTSEVRPELVSDALRPLLPSQTVQQATQARQIVTEPTIQPPLTLTETATSESLTPIQTQRPAESKAGVELAEQQPLVISQHQLVEQETTRTDQSTPTMQQVRVVLSTNEAVVTGQQQQVQHGSDYQVQKPAEVSLAAKVVPSSQGKAAQVTETQTGSFAGQLATAERVTEETAQLSMASMETATVSQVEDYRKEADWVPGTQVHPVMKTAQAVTTSELRSVIVEQTQTAEAGGQLYVPKATPVDTTSSVTSLLETPSLFAPEVLQKEKLLEEFVAGQSQSARPVVAPTEQRTVQISEVQTNIRESPLDINRPAGQTAKASLPESSEVAIKGEHLVMDCVAPQKEFQPAETAKSSVSFTEQRAVSVGHVVEAGSESGLLTAAKPEEKTATRLIPEQMQTSVANVQLAYKEGELDDFVSAQGQTARPVAAEEQKTVIVSEVHPAVSEAPLEQQTTTAKFARPSQPTQEVPVMEQVTVMDFTTPKADVDAVVEERPTVTVTEQRAVSVAQVVEGSTGTELVPEVKKKSKKATRVLPEKIETSVQDVQPAFKEAPMEEFTAGQVQSARPVTEEQRTVQISQVQTEIKESPLEIEKPVAKMAAVASVPETEVAVVSQDVLMDFTTPQTASKAVETETPTVGVTEHRAVSVAQVVEASSEAVLIPEVKKKTKKASRVLPEKMETTVSQVEIGHKEAPMQEFVPAPSQTASVAADEQKTIQVTQVVSEIRETPLETKEIPAGKKAKVDVQEKMAPTIQEQVVLDESTPQQPKTTEKETASVILPEKKAVSVGSVVEASAESELAPQPKPEKKKATSSLPESEAVVKSQDVLMDTTEPQTAKVVEAEKPVVKLTEQVAVNVAQVVEGSTEAELVPEVKKKSKKATRVLPEKNETAVQDVQVAFKEAPLEEFTPGQTQSAVASAPEEKRTVQVTEVQSEISTTPLPATKRPSPETLKASLPEIQAPVQQETVVMDFTVPKEVSSVVPEVPTVGVTEQRAVSIGQVVESSSEKELVPEVKKKTKKATKILPERTETSVENVQPAFKEAPLEDFSAGQTQMARPVADDEKKTVEVSQVQPAIKEEPLELKKPETKTATASLPESEVAVVSQDVLMDFTVPQTAKVVETETPKVTVTEQRAVSVSQVVEGSSEAELVPESKPKTKKASRSLPRPSEQVSVAQVQLTEKTESLEPSIIPSPVPASVTDVPAVEEVADVVQQVATMAPEEEVSFSDDSFQSLPSSSSTLIEDTMMTAASSLEDLVVELQQTPVVLQDDSGNVEASIQLPSSPVKKVEEGIQEEFSVKPKPKPKVEQVEEVETGIVLTKPKQPEQEEQSLSASLKIAEEVVDVSATKKVVKKKKKVVKEEAEEESVTISAPKAEEPTEPVASEATFSIQKEAKPLPAEDVEEVFSLKKKPEEPKQTTETVETTMQIRKPKKSKPYQVEEVEDSIQLVTAAKKIQKEEPEATVEEVVESGATFKLKEQKEEIQAEAEDVEEQFQIGLKPSVKPIPQPEDVEEQLTITKPKRKTKKAVEEASASHKAVIPAPEEPDQVVVELSKKETPYRVEEFEDEVQVKPILKKKKKKVVVQEADSSVESGAILKLKEKEEEEVDVVENVEEQFQVGLKPKRKVHIQAEDVEGDEFSLKRAPKPIVVQETTEESASLVVRRPADNDDSALTLTEQSSESQQVSDSGVVSITDVTVSKIKKKKSHKVQDVEDAYAVLARKVKEGLEGDDVEGGATLKLKSPPDGSEASEDVQEEFNWGLKPRRVAKPSISIEADESLRFKIPSKPKTLAPALPVEDAGSSASLTVARAATSFLADTTEETTAPLEPMEGEAFFSLCSYVADTEEAMNLVEGERVYVLEWHNSDWWFVKKHLTEETGWVPAQYLKDDVSYTHYVKKKLDEKINKLPVFDVPADESKAQAPKFLTKLASARAPDGTSIVFECKVEGTPRPVITWFRQTAMIKSSQDFQMVYDEETNIASLTIAEVFPEDAGTFTCVAKNSAGFASSSAELVVEAPLSDHGSDTTITSRRSLSRESSLMDILEGIPPTFSQRPKTKTVDEGTDVELECRLVAVPEPDVAWFHNGKRIKGSDRIALVGQSDVHMYCSIVQIRDVCMADEGTYDIIARNREGEAVSHVVLNVKVKGAKKMAPVVDQQLKSASVQQGHSVTLVAKVSGVPTPAVKWYRNGIEMTPSSVKTDDKGVTSTVTTTLVLKSAQPEDDGDYMVNAENEHGQVQTSATLTVVVPQPQQQQQPDDVIQFVEKFGDVTVPEVRADSAPEFDVKIKDLEIKERQPATFTVEVSDETANVTWHKDGEPVDVANTERFELVTDGRKRSLTIRSVSLLDEGEYTCSLGEQECTAELVVIELPPEITLRLKDVTVKRGEEASFEIELTKGDAKIQWIRNGSEVQLSQHIQLAIDGKRQRLVIYDCGPEDDCEYACVIGDQKSAARLTVLKPEVDFVAKLPQVLVAPMGQDVTFNIQLTKDTGEVTWLKNGEVVVDSEKIKIGKDGCNRMLTIVKAAIVDSAEYTCVLEAMKTSTMLTVEVPKVPPTIATDQVKTEVWVKRGEDAIIEVPFNGFPTPKAEWTFKGKTIRKTKRSVAAITETSATLTLKAVEENEAGQYTCKLINECGDVSVSATVKIVEKPSNPSAPECLETADDSITIMWKPPAFNGGSVITNYIIEYQEKTTKKWTVANKDVVVVETTYMVTKLTTNVEYRFRVTAVNTAGPGTPSSESCLFKAAKAAIPEAPSIKEPLKDCTAGLKETATLTCLIVGVPTPTLRWFKDDDEFTPKSSSYDKGQARLVLANTNEEAAGRYMCVASNDSGSCETSCTLVIQEAPKIVPEKKAKVYKTQVEKNWSISAKVTGLPRPEVTWTKNGASIEGNTHYISVVETQSSTACSTTLTIINTERTDTAKYTLTATNVAGTVTHDITLKISDKPSKPQGPFEPKEIDKTSVKMEWKPPLDDGGIELKGYNVEYSEIFKEQWKKVEEVSTQTICHIKNLTEGLEYVFRVNATNDVGTSDFLVSEPVLVRSQFDVPSAPRGPLDVSGMTDTTLVLTWLAPTSDGGSPLTEYLVERREVSKKAWQKVGSTDGKTLNIEATGLKKGTSYNFRITAQNELGYGPPFSPEDVIIAGKKLTPPSPPTNLTVADITSRSVTLQWAPPASSGGAELTGYIVEKMLDGTDKWEKMVTLDPSVTVHCLQNLKEKSEFFFRVLSENPMGLSAPAETEKVSLKTHATPPSPPTSPLEVRPVGPNSIMVEWGIPDSDGGAAIEGYIVAVRDSRKTMWMEVGQVDADTTRLIVKDMQEGHKYYVRVFARNEVGLSDPLETEEPVKVVRPPDYLEPGVAGPAHKDPTASLSLSTETLSSWMREANVDADIRFYSRSSLLRRDEYFFRVWYYSRQLFK